MCAGSMATSSATTILSSRGLITISKKPRLIISTVASASLSLVVISVIFKGSLVIVILLNESKFVETADEGHKVGGLLKPHRRKLPVIEQLKSHAVARPGCL